MYTNSLSCIRMKRSESSGFRIESDMRQCCGMSSWLFNVYMDVIIKRSKNGDGEDGS